MMALRPAALSFRFLRTGAVDEAAPDCFLAAAHLFRWAAAILARAAADILRPTGVGPLPSGALGFNIWRRCGRLTVLALTLIASVLRWLMAAVLLGPASPG